MQFQNVFGMCQDHIDNQMTIVHNNIVVFYVGVNLIAKDLQLKTCEFLVKEGGLHNVTALAVLKSEKGLIVAVGESSDSKDRPYQISIYMKKKWSTLKLEHPLLGVIK